MSGPGRLAVAAAACGMAVAIALSCGTAVAGEVLGRVSQPLVAGTETSPQEQQGQGLVQLTMPDGSCSGVMLNNEWVMTAAHCFPTPIKVYQIAITASWPKQQTREGIELHLLDNDIALVRISAALEGMDPSFNMPVYTGTVTPGRVVRAYGAGIYALAKGKGASAQQTLSDDKFRSGDFQVSHVDDVRFWFPPGAGGTIPAGGDSGGPAFVNAGGQSYLAGISSKCMATVLPGKPKVKDDWTWVNRSPNAATPMSGRCGRRCCSRSARRRAAATPGRRSARSTTPSPTTATRR